MLASCCRQMENGLGHPGTDLENCLASRRPARALTHPDIVVMRLSEMIGEDLGRSQSDFEINFAKAKCNAASFISASTTFALQQTYFRPSIYRSWKGPSRAQIRCDRTTYHHRLVRVRRQRPMRLPAQQRPQRLHQASPFPTSITRSIFQMDPPR